VVWFNSNIAKLRWTTTEEATTKVTVVNSSGSVTINRTFEGSAFDREHVIRIRGMHPGQNYDLTIEATDPSGNTAQSTYTNAIAAQNHLFDSCHTTDVVITQGSATTGNPVPYSVEFTVVDEDLAPSVGTKIQYKVVEWLGTSQTVTGPTWTGTGTNSSGKLTLNLTSTMNKGSGAELEVIVMKMGSISSPGLMHFHSLEKTFSDKTTL
jgi:hypothetical protein